MSLLGRLQLLVPVRFRVGGINRAPSALLARSVPWLSIMLASVLVGVPFIASAPLLPPFGLLMLLAWTQMRPGLMPVWAGLPLGAFDDLYSGQPPGSAIFLWSLAMLVLVVIEARIPWRNYLLDWLVAAALMCTCIAAMLVFANASGGNAGPATVLPQLAGAVLLYPLVGRSVSMLDRLRLIPIVDLG